MAIRESMPGQDAYTAAAAAAAHEPAGLPSSAPTASFWLQSLSPTLAGFRSTPDLPETVDVAIVGSGITGAFAADALANSGLSVLLLEAREFCSGATGRNGGHCQPSMYGTPAEVSRFELATFRFLRDFVADHNIDCDWTTTPGGGVHAYLDSELFAAATEAVEHVQATQPDLAGLVKVVDAATASETLRLRNTAGAVVQANAASVWPYKLIAWVLERLARSPSTRVNLQSNMPVERLARTPAGAWALQTPRGRVVARRVLLATNAYTSHLLPAFADLIVPVRGQVAALVPPAAPQLAPRLDYSYVFFGKDPVDNSSTAGHDNDRDEYLIQLPFRTHTPGGHLILGGGRQRAARCAVGEWRDDTVELQVARYLRRNLAPVLDVGAPSDAPEIPADYEWTGIMAFSRDQFPWIGEVPKSVVDPSSSSSSSSSNLYISAGYTGHGMPRAALAGRIIAYQIRASLGISGDDPAVQAALPSVFRITADRVRRARAACDPVAISDRRGLMGELQQFLASCRA